MTVEGIHGNEEMPDAAHDAALIFTRYLAGPGDYTPCWMVSRVKNTLAHQLAMPCVYSSGFQFLFWYHQPHHIKEKDPALDFWREIPTIWDETKALQGEIGKYAVIARRTGSKWFVSGLNGMEKRTFGIKLDFLAPVFNAENADAPQNVAEDSAFSALNNAPAMPKSMKGSVRKAEWSWKTCGAWLSANGAAASETAKTAKNARLGSFFAKYATADAMKKA